LAVPYQDCVLVERFELTDAGDPAFRFARALTGSLVVFCTT
jgi:hypothetical protein